MMKRITSGILLTGFVWSSLGIFSRPPQVTAVAQTQKDGNLFYLYKGQRIPLNQRQDTIAVAFKKVATRNLAAPPLYLQLQQDLQSSIRTTTPPRVSPLGNNYAVVSLPMGTRDVSKIFNSKLMCKLPYQC
jgi:serine protease